MFENDVTEELLEAGKEEKQIAIENVVVDAGWSKRSHKHSYNANSGVGVIFGNATKGLLYIGVRNKYCSICSIAEKKGNNVPDHQCLEWFIYFNET